MDQSLALRTLRALVSLRCEKNLNLSNDDPIIKKLFSDNEIVVKRGLHEIFKLAFKTLNSQIASLALAAGLEVTVSLKIELSNPHALGVLYFVKDDPALLKIALSFGFDPNVRLKTGNTLLHVVTASSEIEIIKLVLEAKVNPNIRNFTGHTPLMIAAMRGNTQILELLIKAGGDPWMRDKNRRNSLHLAILNRKLDCSELIKVTPSSNLSVLRWFEYLRFCFWYYSIGYLDVNWKKSRGG